MPEQTLSIPIPSVPELTALVGFSLAFGGLAVGLIITLWGRRVHYLLAAAVGACAGLAAAPLVIDQAWVDFDPSFVQLAVVLIIAAASVALAWRVTWAVLFGMIGATIAGVTLLLLQGTGQISDQAGQSLLAWWQNVPPVILDVEAVEQLWAEQRNMVLMTVLPAGLIPLVIGLVFRRAGIFLMTSLIGAIICMAGVVTGMSMINADALCPRKWPDFAVLGVAVIIITLIGAIFQSVRAGAAAKQKKETAPEPASD